MQPAAAAAVAVAQPAEPTAQQTALPAQAQQPEQAAAAAAAAAVQSAEPTVQQAAPSAPAQQPEQAAAAAAAAAQPAEPNAQQAPGVQPEAQGAIEPAGSGPAAAVAAQAAVGEEAPGATQHTQGPPAAAVPPAAPAGAEPPAAEQPAAGLLGGAAEPLPVSATQRVEELQRLLASLGAGPGAGSAPSAPTTHPRREVPTVRELCSAPVLAATADGSERAGVGVQLVREALMLQPQDQPADEALLAVAAMLPAAAALEAAQSGTGGQLQQPTLDAIMAGGCQGCEWSCSAARTALPGRSVRLLARVACLLCLLGWLPYAVLASCVLKPRRRGGQL